MFKNLSIEEITLLACIMTGIWLWAYSSGVYYTTDQLSEAYIKRVQTLGQEHQEACAENFRTLGQAYSDALQSFAAQTCPEMLEKLKTPKG